MNPNVTVTTTLRRTGLLRTTASSSYRINKRWQTQRSVSSRVLGNVVGTCTDMVKYNNYNYNENNAMIQTRQLNFRYQSFSNNTRPFLPFNLTSTFQRSSTDFSTTNNNIDDRLWSIIQLIKNNVPKGFEDFFPDGVDKKKSPTDSTETIANEGKQTQQENNSTTAKKSDETDEKKSSTFASKDQKEKKNKKKKKSSSPLGDDDAGNIPGLIALLAIVVILRSVLEDEETSRGEEITFTEFRNRYLLTGAVEKLIVVNNKIAQVILKPNYVETTPMHSVATAAGMISSSNSGIGDVMDHHSNDADEITKWTSAAASSDDFGSGGRGLLTKDRRNSKKVPYFYLGSVENLEEKLTKAQASVHPESWIEVQYIQRTNWALELFKTLPFFAFVAAIYFGTRGAVGGISGGIGGRGGSGGGGMGGIFSVGKSTHKKIKPEDVDVTFADVAGCDQAKAEISEFVDFLKDSSRFTKLGAKIPKGALLSGPPGTGKTLLARATAGEAGVPFYSISGSDFIEMFVGVGPSRVRDLFKEARANAPCIVFIDEIDAVGRQRGRGGFGGGNDERENTLNQLLVEMDGFSPTTGIVVLAGTNRVDILDQALTRPGRFDRQVLVDKPDLQGRKEIFKVHLRGIKLAKDIEEYAGRLAGLTPGFAGADIANICNEAAIVAARRKADAVSMEDFEKATDRIIGGLESNKIMSPQERSVVAYHEAGHAIAGWFLEHADPLLKVTIIPRASGALGFAQYLPKEVFLRSQDQIMDIVCMALAGRAAEQVFFGRVTTGASDDLRRVTQLVYSTIKDFGMNPKVGQLAFTNDENAFGGSERTYSDSVAEAMDDEARSIVNAAYERTVNLIQAHKEEVQKVAQLLIEKETITHDDIYELVGPRPFAHDTAYNEYVTSKGLGTKVKEEDEKDKSSVTESTFSEEHSGQLTPGLA